MAVGNIYSRYCANLPPADYAQELRVAISGYGGDHDHLSLHKIWDLVIKWLVWHLVHRPQILRGYEIEEVLAEAYLLLPGVLKNYSPKAGSFLTYYSRAVRNMLWHKEQDDLARARKYDHHDSEWFDTAQVQMTEEDERRELEDLLSDLDPACPVDRTLGAYIECYLREPSLRFLQRHSGMTPAEMAEHERAAMGKLRSILN